MSFIFKCIGGILIIVGICISGGLLTLPVTDSTGEFLTSLLILITSWIFMNFGAYFTLEITNGFLLTTIFPICKKRLLPAKV